MDMRKSFGEQKFKIMMLGDAGVGKTSIAKRFVDNDFKPNYIHTIGIDFLEKQIECGEDIVRLQVWDTAGQDRFRTIIKPYYRGAAGIVLVYDVTDEKTFFNIEEWIRSISENTQTCQVIQKVLMANKVDLPQEMHQVEREKGLELANKHNLSLYETSAKDGTGIEEAFRNLAQLCYEVLETSSENSKLETEVIKLENIPVTRKPERKCCGLQSNKRSLKFSSTKN